jgi:hypothetical protein
VLSWLLVGSVNSDPVQTISLTVWLHISFIIKLVFYLQVLYIKGDNSTVKCIIVSKV